MTFRCVAHTYFFVPLLFVFALMILRLVRHLLPLPTPPFRPSLLSLHSTFHFPFCHLLASVMFPPRLSRPLFATPHFDLARLWASFSSFSPDLFRCVRLRTLFRSSGRLKAASSPGRWQSTTWPKGTTPPGASPRRGPPRMHARTDARTHNTLEPKW